MRRLICIMTCLVWAFAAQAESAITSYRSQSDVGVETIAAEWMQVLPNDAQHRVVGATHFLDFTGVATPAQLEALVQRDFPAFPDGALLAGLPVSFSLALSPGVTGTDMQLMVLGTFDAARDLPKGAAILLDEQNGQDCQGQMVLSHDMNLDQSTKDFENWAKLQGFELSDLSDASVSFFIGQRPDCAMFMYIQPDPDADDRALVVVRYLEEE